MSTKAYDIVAEYSDAIAEEKTHVICYPNNQQIAIDPSKRKGFWEDYCKVVHKNSHSDDQEPLFLAELVQPTQVSQLIIPLELKFGPGQDVSEVYTERFLLRLIKAFQDSIKEHLILNRGSYEQICACLESKENYENVANKETSVFLELRFPKCRITSRVAQDLIIPTAITNLRNNKAISELTHQPINDWKESIVSNDSPAMYGSTRGPMTPKLNLRGFYRCISDVNKTKHYDVELQKLGKVLSADQHKDVVSGLADLSLFECESEHSIEWWLPMILSVDYGKNITLIKNTESSGKTRGSVKNSIMEGFTNSGHRRRRTKNSADDPRTMASIFISLLGAHRATSDSFWIDVGKCLYNIYDGGESGLAQWKRFSRRREGSPDYECDYRWYTFASDNLLDHRTLAFYAREDNPDGYEDWHRNWYLPYIKKALTSNHLDVAILFYRIFWLNINFVPGTGRTSGTWYIFQNHKWRKSPSGSEIRILATDEFIERVEEYWHAADIQRHKTTDESEKARFAATSELCKKLVDNLKKDYYLRSYLNMAADRYVKGDPDFVEKLDQNELLTGVANGVMEVVGHKCIYRHGKPQDYVSVASRVAYPVNCTMEHQNVKDLMKWYHQSFVDEDVLKYQKKADASCMRGGNSDKIFMSWLGGADNSKSMWKKLKDAVYGNLSADVPLSVLIGGHKKGGGPSPELAQLATARVAFLCEPDDGVEFKNGILKMLTGGDSFFARMCNQDGGKTLAKFKLYLVANQIPSFSNCDKAIKERFIIVPFSSTWVKPGLAPETEEEQMRQRIFPQDKFFERKIPAMASAALWLWAQWYEDYSKEGLEPPAIIREHTQNYWDENDIYQVFLNERIQVVYTDASRTEVNINSKITVSDLYTNFYEWFKESYPGTNSPPDKTTSKNQLSRRLGTRPGPDNCWSGVRFKNTGVAGVRH